MPNPNHLKHMPTILILGDALVFIYFAVQGRATHDLALGSNPALTVLAVAAPFAVPWFALAALLGVFRAETIAHTGPALFWTAIAWLCAGSMGLVARSMILQRPLLPTFAAVALGVNAALLLAWHAGVSALAQWVSKRSVKPPREP